MSRRSNRSRSAGVGLAIVAALTLAGGVAWAQEGNYPDRPVRLIIPQQPGAASDLLGRMFAPRLGEALGQSIVVDNRAGAGGIIGAEAGAKAPPDGYTLLVGASAWNAIAPQIYRKVGYEAIDSFALVSLFAVGQNLLVVHPSVAANTVQELVALMRDKPNQLNMATAGVGAASHLAGILLTSLAGVSALHVPYKGAGQSVGAVVSGEAHWSFTPMQAPLGMVRAGKLRALAVGSHERSRSLPDVPTVAESGYPDYYATSWYGVMAPRGTPQPVIDKLHAATVKVVHTPEFRDQMVTQGAEAKSLAPAEFVRFAREEYERVGKVIRAAGIKVDN